MIQPTVPDDQVKSLFPVLTVVALPSGKGYIRKTPQPWNVSVLGIPSVARRMRKQLNDSWH